MVKNRIQNEDFQLELPLDLLKFEGMDEKASKVEQSQIAADGWDAPVSESMSALQKGDEQPKKRARLS